MCGTPVENYSNWNDWDRFTVYTLPIYLIVNTFRLRTDETLPRSRKKTMYLIQDRASRFGLSIALNNSVQRQTMPAPERYIADGIRHLVICKATATRCLRADGSLFASTAERIAFSEFLHPRGLQITRPGGGAQKWSSAKLRQLGARLGQVRKMILRVFTTKTVKPTPGFWVLESFNFCIIAAE